MGFSKRVICRPFFQFLNLNCTCSYLRKLFTSVGAVVGVTVSYFFEVESDFHTYFRQMETFKVRHLPQNILYLTNSIL